MGRFFRQDHAKCGHAFESPYIFAGNTPIRAIDEDGKAIYFVTADGAAADVERLKVIFNTLANTEAGQKLISKYAASQTHDIYLSVADFDKNYAAAVTFEGDLVQLKDNRLNMNHYQTWATTDKDAMASIKPFSNVDFRRSVGRKISFISVSSQPFKDPSYDNYELSETIYHEMWAHIDNVVTDMADPKGFPGYWEHIKYGSFVGSDDLDYDFKTANQTVLDAAGNSVLDHRPGKSSTLVLPQKPGVPSYDIRLQLIKLRNSGLPIKTKWVFSTVNKPKTSGSTGGTGGSGKSSPGGGKGGGAGGASKGKSQNCPKW